MECIAKNVREITKRVYLQDDKLKTEYERALDVILEAAKNGKSWTYFETDYPEVSKLCQLLRNDGFSADFYDDECEFTKIAIGWWE